MEYKSNPQGKKPSPRTFPLLHSFLSSRFLNYNKAIFVSLRSSIFYATEATSYVQIICFLFISEETKKKRRRQSLTGVFHGIWKPPSARVNARKKGTYITLSTIKIFWKGRWGGRGRAEGREENHLVQNSQKNVKTLRPRKIIWFSQDYIIIYGKLKPRDIYPCQHSYLFTISWVPQFF